MNFNKKKFYFFEKQREIKGCKFGKSRTGLKTPMTNDKNDNIFHLSLLIHFVEKNKEKNKTPRVMLSFPAQYTTLYSTTLV